MQSLLFLSAIAAFAGHTIAENPAQVSPEQEGMATDSVARNISLDGVEVISTVKENTAMRQQPSSVSIVSKEQLEASHATSLKGVSSLVPNFFMPDYGSRITSAVYIRGIGSRINTPAVGMYVDNVPYVDKSAFDFNFFDIERVDVLRGPQGTLYGRNAMGGIVRVYTKNPFSYDGTDVKLGYATADNHRNVAVTHYHRVSSQFAFSGGGYYEGGDGFFKNSFTDKNADAIQAGGARFRSIFKPSDRLNFDLSLSYDYSDEGAYPYYYTGSFANPAFEAESIGKICNNREHKYRRGLLNTGLNIEYKAPSFVMNAITGYQNINDRMFMDQDFISKDIYTLEQKQRINTFTEEVTFKNANKDSRWNWVSGVNFMYQALNTQGPVVFYGDGLSWLESNINSHMPDVTAIPSLQRMGFTSMSVNFRGDALRMGGTFDTPTFNTAVFHQSTLRIAPKLLATLGLRLDYEKMQMSYNAPATVDYGFTLANPSPRMHVNLPELSSPLLYDGKIDSDYLTLLPKASLMYELSKQSNLYASVAKGQRSGGYNVQMFSDLLQGSMQNAMMAEIQSGVAEYLKKFTAMGMPASVIESVTKTMADNMPVSENPTVDQVVFKPEYSWNFELGTHLGTADRKYQLDAAVFLINTRDQQIARFAPTGLGRMMVNAGKSRSYGAELSAFCHPDEHWNITANYGFTNAKFTDYDAGAGNDYTDNYVPFVPKHTLHLDAAYTWQMPASSPVHALTLGADYRGAGSIYWTEANNMKQGFYSLLGARLAIETKAATIMLWGRNLTDACYNTFSFESAGRGFEQHGKPIQFGVDVRFTIK